MRKDAVSPVIATILMVAISVVLVTSLYLMVMGYSAGQHGYAPSMSMVIHKTGEGNYTLTVFSVTKNDVRWSDIFAVCNPSGALALPSTTYVSAGDVVSISGLHDGMTYKITLSYEPSGSACYQIALTTY